MRVLSRSTLSLVVKRYIDIVKTVGSIPTGCTRGAYSSAVERLHGMHEAGVRLSLGPPIQITSSD